VQAKGNKSKKVKLQKKYGYRTKDGRKDMKMEEKEDIKIQQQEIEEQ
jgi:hypothetical protein